MTSTCDTETYFYTETTLSFQGTSDPGEEEAGVEGDQTWNKDPLKREKERKNRKRRESERQKKGERVKREEREKKKSCV